MVSLILNWNVISKPIKEGCQGIGNWVSKNVAFFRGACGGSHKNLKLFGIR